MADAKQGSVQEFKMVVMGGGGVGKSALTLRLITADSFLEEYDPTIEDSYRKQLSIDNEMCVLDILDTAGQEEFSSMQEQWMRDGKGFMLVYSVTSRATFDEVQKLREKIIRTKNEDEKTPIVLVGNKVDLATERKVDTKEGEDLAAKWKIPFFETSAKLKLNNESCFHELVRVMRRYEDELNKKKGNKKDDKKGWKCTIL